MAQLPGDDRGSAIARGGAMTSSAIFSPCGRFRLRLDRVLCDGLHAAVCMANPSKAGADQNDPTIATLNRLLPARGIGRYTVCNQDTYIATDPADMRAWRDEFAARDFMGYRAHRRAVLDLIREISAEVDIRIAAWGRLMSNDPLVIAALSHDGRYPLYALGFTGDGQPKHPLARGKERIANDVPLILWRPAA